ncbi:CatB-related O-acetyltransferase [Flagellatimonas centrodinii]|uniref:CatB-related O-acetyltransferase n=1 Tax=Flagellatimonas centrodinii TaxID=2806210 RepID=UPI0023BAE661|nr:CatB-related O-acetyltransferase [Flagellatimonas centrodinii]
MVETPPPQNLLDCGLMAAGVGGPVGRLDFERPAWTFTHHLKDCTLGAFTFFNSGGHTAAYRVHFGRYAQIGESSILGPPEHPMDGFSSHPFAFTRPRYLPKMYEFEDFRRLAPEADDGPSYVDTVPNDTWIGHEAYVGACSFVKRGVRIGDGACIGAGSVVTRDVPPYAIAVGSPARVIRMRFTDTIIERMLALQWWRYDLAPFKREVDFTQVEPTLAFFEGKLAEGALPLLVPPTFRVQRRQDQYSVTPLPQPLF